MLQFLILCLIFVVIYFWLTKFLVPTYFSNTKVEAKPAEPEPVINYADEYMTYDPDDSPYERELERFHRRQAVEGTMDQKLESIIFLQTKANKLRNK